MFFFLGGGGGGGGKSTFSGVNPRYQKVMEGPSLCGARPEQKLPFEMMHMTKESFDPS